MKESVSALVVDDEPHIRRFLEFTLRDLGVETIYMNSNGSDAVDTYEAHAPDLVLLDVHMNKMNGIRALDRIMKINPDAVVVMMTAVDTFESVAHCQKTGATNYILKSTSHEEIKNQIGKVVRSCQGRN